MEYLFGLLMGKGEIVLGNFEGEEKDKVLGKISSLIASGSFFPEKETPPFSLVRYLYEEMEVVKAESAPIEIRTSDGQISLPKGWSFKEKSKVAQSIAAK